MIRCLKISMTVISLLFSQEFFAQTARGKQLRAFPITDYMVDLDDSTRVIQVRLPDGVSIEEKQFGLIRGTYRSGFQDTVLKGYGRCQLIKSEYYYFAISGNKSGVPAKEGDLLYTMVDRRSVFEGQLNDLSSHYITLQDVYGNSFYDPHVIFSSWKEADENRVLDTMIRDIHFTANYFLENNPSMNQLIKTGEYKNRKLLEVMTHCDITDMNEFFFYVKARPLLYAGREWKLSEVFATWLSEGAPMVVRD